MAFSGQRKEERIAGALERQAASAAQSPKERLATLDVRLGVGLGAVKERAKLLAKMTPVAKRPSKDATARAKDPVNNFVIKVGGKPVAIQSIGQIRTLARNNDFDPKPIVKEYRDFKRGV